MRRDFQQTTSFRCQLEEKAAVVFALSKNGPEIVFIKHENVLKSKSLYFNPIMADVDSVPGVTQAVLRTLSGVNGNKIFLTRLFYCLPTVFISFQILASDSLTGPGFKFTLMRRGADGEEGREKLRGGANRFGTWIKRSRLSRL